MKSIGLRSLGAAAICALLLTAVACSKEATSSDTASQNAACRGRAERCGGECGSRRRPPSRPRNRRARRERRPPVTLSQTCRRLPFTSTTRKANSSAPCSRRLLPSPKPPGANNSPTRSTRSPARRAPNARSPASCSRTSRRVPTCASAATCRCTIRRPSSNPAPVGRASTKRSRLRMSSRRSTPATACGGLRFFAPAVRLISGTFSTTARSPPAAVTASTPLRFVSFPKETLPCSTKPPRPTHPTRRATSARRPSSPADASGAPKPSSSRSKVCTASSRATRAAPPRTPTTRKCRPASPSMPR